ncbi:hypothetical protein OG963_00230 [Streptomyces sp. NBC_01707]
MAATDADGKRLGEQIVPTAPTHGEATAFGAGHRTNYVSVRHGNDITLYGRDATGTWSVLTSGAPAAVVVELRRQHDALCGPRPAWDEEPEVGRASTGDYLLTAIGVDGEPFGERVSPTRPTPAEAAALGDLHESDYVIAGRHDSDVVTLYGRGSDNSWSVIAADVDVDTAEEMCLWFDLTRRHGRRLPAGHHPLEDVSMPEDRRMAAVQAISLVVEEILSRRLDYPTQGLTADRFAAGWSVYAPVNVDDSDPMAFLDMPVGRSVFLVSDAGRIKEISSSVPPHQAEEMFTAEETYLCRSPAADRFMTDLKEEVMRLDAASGGAAGISSFTVVGPSTEEIVARASRLVGPITQQLAQLGPPGWDHFTAIFSFTVSGEVAQLRFRSGKRRTETPVPEQIALLVRRQRHLAAHLPAGPWWRLLLTVSHSVGTGAHVMTEYDYGDEPFPTEDLLAPHHYRNDFAAYPRGEVPGWLKRHAAAAGKPAASEPRAATDHRTEPRGPVAPPPRMVNTVLRGKQLYADERQIVYGRHSIELEEVEWVSYSATHTIHRGFLFPSMHDTSYQLSVGHDERGRKPVIGLGWFKNGKNHVTPPEWIAMVEFVQRYVEPQLVAGLVDRVRRGETVRIGGLQIRPEGLLAHRFNPSWSSLAGARAADGNVWFYLHGQSQAATRVPLDTPNAVLLPRLIATFTA